MRLKNGALIRLLDVGHSLKANAGEIGRYNTPVLVGGDTYHKVNFVNRTNVHLTRTSFEVIEHRLVFDIGEKVFLCTAQKDLIGRPFVIVDRIKIKMYRIRYHNLELDVYLHQILPVSIPNKLKKNILIKE